MIIFIYEVSFNLLRAVKAGVAQALSGDHVTDAVKTMTAVVFTVLTIGAVGAAHLTPVTRTESVSVTRNAIFKLRRVSHRHYHSAENALARAR